MDPKTTEEWHLICDYIAQSELELKEIEQLEEVDQKHSTWKIFRIINRRTKYIYDLFKAGEISKQTYKYCVDNFFCDHNLVCFWKKNGYEKLCCLLCIQKTEQNKQCICRVPKRKIKEKDIFECKSCGCRGCSGY